MNSHHIVYVSYVICVMDETYVFLANTRLVYLMAQVDRQSCVTNSHHIVYVSYVICMMDETYVFLANTRHVYLMALYRLLAPSFKVLRGVPPKGGLIGSLK